MSRHAPGDGFALALLGALADDTARAAARRVLREWAGCRVYLPARRAAELQRSALALVELERDPDTAVVRLAQRHGCSHRTARRYVAAARRSLSGQGLAMTPPTIGT